MHPKTITILSKICCQNMSHGPLILSCLIISLIIKQTSPESSTDLVRSPLFENSPQSNQLKNLQKKVNVFKAKHKDLFETSSKKADNWSAKRVKQILSEFLSTLTKNRRRRRRSLQNRKKKRERHRPEWKRWTEWSACSVTCGKGRIIRWRHCGRHCEGIETEMEERSCQMPECPRKLFGFLKL